MKMVAVFPIYRARNGETLLVTAGISGGGCWFTARRGHSGALHRVKSPYLPLRDTRADAQVDLDAYAERHKLERVEP